MSRKYKSEDTVPSDVICARLKELSNAVTEGRDSVAREFTMRIPAEVDRDADIVLSDAAQRIEELEADQRRLEFLLDNRRFIDQHVITGSFVCLVATSGVLATRGSQFARDKRGAIDKAMEQSSDTAGG